MTFAAAFMYAQAQEAETAAPVAQLDSLTANAEGEQVQVAYRKVNQNDLLGGVSFRQRMERQQPLGHGQLSRAGGRCTP